MQFTVRMTCGKTYKRYFHLNNIIIMVHMNSLLSLNGPLAYNWTFHPYPMFE